MTFAPQRSEMVRLDVARRGKAQEWPHALPQEVELVAGQIQPIRMLPGALDLGINLFDRVGIKGNLGDLVAQVGDHLPGLRGLLIVQEAFHQV